MHIKTKMIVLYENGKPLITFGINVIWPILALKLYYYQYILNKRNKKKNN